MAQDKRWPFYRKIIGASGKGKTVGIVKVVNLHL